MLASHVCDGRPVAEGGDLLPMTIGGQELRLSYSGRAFYCRVCGEEFARFGATFVPTAVALADAYPGVAFGPSPPPPPPQT